VGLFKHLARYNLNQCKLSRADSCQGRHVSFNRRRENTKGKVTEHEVPGGDAPNDDTQHHRTALDFSDPAINKFGEKL